MTMVWELDVPNNFQSVLLVLADFADDDGTNAYPSVDRISWKTGYSERQVQRILRQLDQGVTRQACRVRIAAA